MDRLLQKYCGLTLQQLRFQEIMQDLTTVMERHNLVLPPNLWMLTKTVVMMEGVGLKLDPDFDIFSVSEPIVRQLKWKMLLPSTDWSNILLRHGTEWGEFAMLLPRVSRRVLERIEQGRLFDVELFDADKLTSGLGHLVNRLSLSIIIAAMVIGLAILIATTSKESPIQLLIVSSFVAVLILGFWLMISIFRGR
jgi:ubiquinone biosynthesis protein